MARDDEMMTPGDDASDALVPSWTTDGHLDEGTIHTWLDGAFDAAQASVVAAHVDACAVCRESVAEARGFIAGASRMVRALDAVPSDVVPLADVERVASRIVAAAVASTDATPIEPARARASRAWYTRSAVRSAAAILVMVAGGTFLLSRDPDVAVSKMDRDVLDSAAPVIAPTPAAARPAAPAAGAASGANRLADQPLAVDRREVRARVDAMSRAKAVVAPSVANAADAIVADTTRGRLMKGEAREVVTAAVRAPLPPAPVAPPASSMSDRSAPARTTAVVAADSARAFQRMAAGGVASAPAPLAQSLRDTATRMVSGRVMTTSGAPAVGVLMTASGQRTAEGVTDSTGTYRLRVTGDSVMLRARMLGFATTSRVLDLRNRDSARVDLRMAPSVLALSAVIIDSNRTGSEKAIAASRPTQNMHLTEVELAPTCWSVQKRGNARMELPTHLLAPLTGVGSVLTLWINWPSKGRNTSVEMSNDLAGTTTGSAVAGGDTLVITVSRRGDDVSGVAVRRGVSRQLEQSLVLTSVATGLCKL